MEESDNLDIASTPVVAPKVDPKILIGVVVLVFLAIYIVITFSAKLSQTSVEPEVEVTIVDQAKIDPSAPIKIESVGVVPDGFPKELILEESIKLGEAYTLDYELTNKRQLTVTFISKKTMVENFAAYDKYLTDEYWIVLNKVESESIGSIYAMKKNEDINITIESGSTNQESKITISLLKK